MRWALSPSFACLLMYGAFRISVLTVGTSFGRPPDAAVLAFGTAVVVALGCLYALVVLRVPSRWIMMVQALLTFGPYAVIGDSWGPISALLLASVLLGFPGRVSWLPAALVALAEFLIRVWWLPGGGLVYAAWATLATGAIGLGFFAMARLAHLVEELRATRAEHASFEVERERLRIANELRAVLGERLAVVIRAARNRPDEIAEVAREALDRVRSVADDYRDRSLAAEVAAARSVLGAAGVPASIETPELRLPDRADAVLAALLRRTVTAALRHGTPEHCLIEVGDTGRLRIVFTGLPGAPLREAAMPVEAEVTEAGGTVSLEARIPLGPRARERIYTPRWLAWVVLLVLEIDHIGTVALKLFGARDLALAAPSMIQVIVVVVCLPLVAVLQLRHVLPREHLAWRGTLLLQIVLVFTPMAFVGDLVPPSYAGLVAGVVLFHMRAPWSWVFAALLVCLPLLLSPGSVVHVTVLLSLVSMVMVYALCRLPVIAAQLEQARRELTRMSVVKERLRIARDVHDLLGFQLSAIAVKGELAVRLADADPGAARVHLAELVTVAEQALSSVRSIAEEGAAPAFGEEVEAARSMLSAAGIDARVRLGATPTGSLGAIVLREAVTNVVRHSGARTCEIETSPEAGSVWLRVSNDGALPERHGRAGNGLLNLTARTEEAGGSLTVRRDGDRFTLTADLGPGPADPAGRKIQGTGRGTGPKASPLRSRS
ncbi:histidine kinase [Streptosporangium sp. NPDC049644]|uniref:sensor histidine kinase n=1 Tax=Streptosporangium sp. NPDC049644 TaxID=3155507 RepID=UPI0034386E40